MDSVYDRINSIEQGIEETWTRLGYPTTKELKRKVAVRLGEDIANSMSRDELANFLDGN